MGSIAFRAGEAAPQQDYSDQSFGQICQLAFSNYPRAKALEIVAWLEPVFSWNFELAQPAIDLEEQVLHALHWIDRKELDSMLVVDVHAWCRNYSDAQMDLARLEATAIEHDQKLEAKTLKARVGFHEGREIEYDFYEWLYRQFRPIINSPAFGEFSNRLLRQMGAVVGTGFMGLLHTRLLEAVCLPCMYILVDLHDEAVKCDAELRLFMAGTPLVGIKSLRPVILAKTPASRG